MKIQYLGTAAVEGIPAMFCMCPCCQSIRSHYGTNPKDVRMRTSALIDNTLQIDFGPDAFQQMLKYQLDYANLRSVLITHSHDDHICIGNLLSRKKYFAWLPDEVPPLIVYGNEKIGEMLGKQQCADRILYQRICPFEPQQIDGYTVTALEAVHCVSNDKNGLYTVEFKQKQYARSEQALFYLIEKDGASILYAHDTGGLTQADLDYLAGKKIDIVSLDCTMGRSAPCPGAHMCAADNLEVRELMLQIGAADEHTVFVANHFSHNGYTTYEEMQKLLPGFVISYDGLILESGKK